MARQSWYLASPVSTAFQWVLNGIGSLVKMLLKDINDGHRISNAPSCEMVLLLDGYLNNEQETKDNYLWGLKGLMSNNVFSKVRWRWHSRILGGI